MTTAQTIPGFAYAVAHTGVFILFMVSRFEVIRITVRAIRFICRGDPGGYLNAGASTVH